MASRPRLRSLNPDFGPSRRGITVADGCCCTCCVQLLVTTAAGMASCGLLGWHWAALETRRGKLKTALLAAIGGFLVGGVVGLIELMLAIEFSPLWWGTLCLCSVIASALGLLLSRLDIQHARLASLAGLRRSWLKLIIVCISAVYATYFASSVASGGEDMSLLLAIVFPLIGASFSIADQRRLEGPVSFTECYLVALVFGGVVAPTLIPVIDPAADYEFLPAAGIGVLIGAASSAWSDQRAGVPMSLTRGTLNGFITALLLVLIFIIQTESLLATDEIMLSTAAALTGGLICFWLGRDLARHRGQRVLLTPVIMSPLPGALLFAFLVTLVIAW